MSMLSQQIKLICKLLYSMQQYRNNNLQVFIYHVVLLGMEL